MEEWFERENKVGGEAQNRRKKARFPVLKVPQAAPSLPAETLA